MGGVVGWAVAAVCFVVALALAVRLRAARWDAERWRRCCQDADLKVAAAQTDLANANRRHAVAAKEWATEKGHHEMLAQGLRDALAAERAKGVGRRFRP